MAKIDDILVDLVSFAVPLSIDAVRVTGTDKKTLIEALDDASNCRLIMKAQTKEAFSEFKGKFGIPSLSILKGLLEIYKMESQGDEVDKSKFKIEVHTIQKDGEDVPAKIGVTTQESTEDHPLMRDNLPKQLSTKEGALKWDVEIVQPAKAKIQKLSKRASVLAGVEKNFFVKTENNQLKFIIGDEFGSGSKSDFAFADGIKANISPPVRWECSKFLSIMNLAEKAKTNVKISNQGVIQINVDSGLVDYEFLLPGFKA